MMRQCEHCHRPFTPADFVKEESKNMEADRKALGLEGTRFLYYACPGCGRDTIFLDILRREGESEEDFTRRTGELEAAVGRVHAEEVRVMLKQRP
jgi:MoaA/NifB/PqqE/SkfB family radical SAM enzyme